MQENHKGCLLKRVSPGSRRGWGTGDGDVEARARRRAAARSKDRQMKEGSEPRPGAGRKWED